MNAEQASKRTVAEAEPSNMRGRPMAVDETAIASIGFAGVMAPACVADEIDGTAEMSIVHAETAMLPTEHVVDDFWLNHRMRSERTLERSQCPTWMNPTFHSS